MSGLRGTVFPTRAHLIQLLGELEEVREWEILEMERLNAARTAELTSVNKSYDRFNATRKWHLKIQPFA